MNTESTGFRLPHDPSYPLARSASDSVRFVLDRCLEPYGTRLCCPSSFVDVEGNAMRWHDFGCLEGPGWAANLVGGAEVLLAYAGFRGDPAVRRAAEGLLDHALLDGFFDPGTGLLRGYRDTQRDEFCLNFKHNDDWHCPGSMARVGSQLLSMAERLSESDDTASLLRRDGCLLAAQGIAGWFADRLRPLENGWFPRRTTAGGEPFPFAAEGGQDPFFATSGDGIFLLAFFAEMDRRGETYGGFPWIDAAERFIRAGGWFGSINHDTYDSCECVAIAVASRTFLRLAETLGRPDFRHFALDTCRNKLDRFKMREDRNGIATRGLLWMEETWDTAYLWENAEVALAWIDAWESTDDDNFLLDAVTVLRAIAKHHHGPHGFLTEGVDWNNHVGRQHHFRDDGSTTITPAQFDAMPTESGAEFGDIQYTEPLLNHLHHVSPVLRLIDALGESTLSGL